MKIPPVKGTRDFYPQDMAVRNWIIDGWKQASIRNGFEEYDGPIFEYLKMFQIKSGDEIAEQLFSLTDRGGRELALRPEMTPTLARMVNQRINSLPRPIKWFSVPRLFRAERPQKGRLREFFQWNIDIIGVDDVLSDAEVIFCALDYLRGVGLTPNDIIVKISSRKLLAAILKGIGIAEERLDSLYVVLDKKDKLPLETFRQMLSEQVPDVEIADKIQTFMETQAVRDISKVVETDLSDDSQDSEIEQAANELIELFDWLDRMGVDTYCKFDPGIVRGLAYYTGIVYEIYDTCGRAKASLLRAIGGGGRYDNLLRDFGGPSIPATGFAIGDCVLSILLEEKGLIKPELQELDYFVVYVEEVYKEAAVKLTMKLRSLGQRAGFSYKSAKLSRQLKEASDQKAKKCVIIGEEFKSNKLAIKDMATGVQEEKELEKFFTEIQA
jgi:histidyl-tRNA synthetase